jgi:pyruvate/2-oxoglutarate dehydrogenase complex dihydrolipoamide acyltransferase (E2) component
LRKSEHLVLFTGDAVAVDDVVAQIETDKVTLDVRSPYNGSLTAFLVRNPTSVLKIIDTL